MRKTTLDNRKEENQRLTIKIFTEGTILKPKSWLTLYSHNSYIPIGCAVELISVYLQENSKAAWNLCTGLSGYVEEYKKGVLIDGMEE